MRKIAFCGIAAVLVFLFLFGCGNEAQDDGGPIPNPDPPTALATEVNSTSSITIGWGEVSGAAGYYIYRSTSVVGIYDKIGTATSTSYTDDKLAAGTTYYYRVATYNGNGTGSQSGYALATTLPEMPTGLTFEVDSKSSITVSWNAVSGATGYHIYRSESDNYDYMLVGSSATTSYTDTGLTELTAYYYKVAAYNSGGEGEQSDWEYAVIDTPGVPRNVTVTFNSSSEITVSWSSVTGVTGYRIYRSESSNGTYTLVGSSATTSYTDTGLTELTAYYYKVVAYNGVGESAQSSYASATTIPIPTGLTATVKSSSEITVGWSSVTDVTGYRVYRSVSADGTYTQVGSSATTSYTNTGLTAGTTYYYKVSAYNSGGESAQSSYALATIQASVIDGAAVTYENETYQTVVIFGQTWFKRNLNYNPSAGNSWCYGNYPDNCTAYGRLYDWATAMALPSNCNSSSCSGQINKPYHQGICPSGWHIPSRDEWDLLSSLVGSPDGTKLKATSGWSNGGNGTDIYGFSALPGGIYYYDTGSFLNAGNYGGYWWSSTEDNDNYAYYRNMSYSSEYAYWYNYYKSYGFSLRCVKD